MWGENSNTIAEVHGRGESEDAVETKKLSIRL